MDQGEPNCAILDAEFAKVKERIEPVSDQPPDATALAAFRRRLMKHDALVRKLESHVQRPGHSTR